MEKQRVVVAMSGGVDSSVTAALLQEQGYEVVGVTMRLSEEARDADPDGRSCCALSSVDDARRVADILGIPHYVMDFTEPFQRLVIDYFTQEYARGRTPNPCIACNRHIKFEGLLEKTRALGAQYIATGHYARITRTDDGTYHLRKGIDAAKDQSYVLYHLTQKMMDHVLFPLGDYCKDEIRRMAEDYGLPVAHKAESQEICFVPRDDYKSYLRTHAPQTMQTGAITDRTGHFLGTHDGIAFYTIGQRRGLGIAAEHPLYVIALDAAENRVIVGTSDEVFARALTASDLSWTLPRPPHEPRRVRAKIRYGKREANAWMEPQGDGTVAIHFSEPQRAVTPGQSIVFYEGDAVLGGGSIDHVIP